MNCSQFRSVFTQPWDVVVFGAGYAGVAAARACRAAGRRVLLVERQAAMLSESGWAFAPDTDGAIAEVLASEDYRTQGWPVLYYATPVAAERAGDLLAAVVVGTKSGLHRLTARQWVDATEPGELLSLLDPQWTPPLPVCQQWHLYFRHGAWPAQVTGEVPCPELPDARLRWEPSRWPNERRLTIELPGDFARPRRAWLPALRALRAARPAELAAAVLTHGSVIPFCVYAAPQRVAAVPANVVAPEWPALLPERTAAGEAAARVLLERPQAAAAVSNRPVELPAPARTATAAVAVAGLGTGGALAALAAARAGANVLAFDPLPFAGGIGTGGGIHYYYMGIPGGLQDEVDHRVQQITPLFGRPAQISGFHPDAKKIALEEMLAEAGVRTIWGATLFAAHASGGRVAAGLIATPRGPVRVTATNWVDATGDGDLAAFAGAAFQLGRGGDGLTHAYSQSSGRAELNGDVAQLKVVNFDAGFCDPTDVEDLTRARLVGLSHYQRAEFTAWDRPTYIAPAIGLRQGRQIATDYTLTLADLIEHRPFPDVVGYTGAHYDNHASDYEFESDEALFWVWVCHQWPTGFDCEIPYRVLLPRGLDNVWLACRALGVSEEAHHSFRMQRDMQRIGEVAGLAAALAAHRKCSSRDLPLAELQARLRPTGALADRQPTPPTPPALEAWLTELKTGPASAALWHIAQAGPAARPALLECLASSDETISWRAAAILAMWKDHRAEPRLLRAITTREVGDKAREVTNRRQELPYVPHWFVAVSLLRLCGTSAALPVLAGLAGEPTLTFHARTAMALTVAKIVARQSPADREPWAELLDRLLATPAPQAVRQPRSGIQFDAPPPVAPPGRALAVEDGTWQLHLAVARARLALRLPVHAAAKAYSADPRALVRRAFAGLQRPVTGD